MLMSYFLNKKYLLPLIMFCTIYANYNTALYEKKNLAKNYYDANLYDDAIIIYEEILVIEKRVFGNEDINLLQTLKKLYELNLLNKDFKKSKQYIQEYLNIQSSSLLNQQNIYIDPLEQLKNILIEEKKVNEVFTVDSLLQIIHNNTSIIKKDSILILPKLLINTTDTTNYESEYSNNDIAIDLINDGLRFLKNDLYTEAKNKLINAIQLNAEIIDVNYLKKIDFGNLQKNLYDSFLEDSKNDSLSDKYHNLFLGIIAFKEENYDESINFLTRYHEFYPSDINALLILGELNFKKGSYLNSMFFFYQALKYDEDNLIANKFLSEIFIIMEDYEQALDILNYISKDNNEHIIFYNLGFCYFKISKFEKSINSYTQAILLDPDDYKTFYQLGMSYKSNKLFKQSLDAFKKSVKINPNWGLGHYELGLIYQMTLNDDLAIYHFELANKNENFDDLNYRLGILYFKNEQFYKSMKRLKEYLVHNMNDIETMKIIGDIFLKLGRFPEAIDIFSRLIENDPNNQSFYYNIASSFYQLNDLDNALDYFLKVIELDEEDYNVYIDIGIIFNKKNLFLEAESYLLKALDCGFTNKNLLMQLGISYGGQKKFLQSLIAFQNALKFSLEDPILHYQIGIIYKELSIFDLAIKNLNFYLEYNKNDEVTLLLIGECHLNLKEYDNAVRIFEKTYKINKNYNALFNIGKSYEKSGDLKNAAKYYKNVIKKNPNHVKSRENLIFIYKNLNKFREAKKECEIIYMLDRSVYNSIAFCRE